MPKPSPLPQAFLDRLERQFGTKTRDAIVAAFGVTRRPTFRANTLKIDDQAVMAELRDLNVPFERVKAVAHAFFAKTLCSRELLELLICEEGKIYVQGISSMMPPLVLDPKPGETVLDLCAAPGSKTSQIAALMQNRGRLVAIEIDEVRFQKLEHTLKLQGVRIAETFFGDAAILCRKMENTFDKILADVPCSAEGRISTSEPRTFRFWSEKNIVAHAKLQRRLLRATVHCLKPGGTLVYSTCTLSPEENELMVDWLLSEYPELKSERVVAPLPAQACKNGSTYFLPDKDHEGLFVAKIIKTL